MNPAAGNDCHRLRVGSMCTGYGGLDLAAHAAYGTEAAWCAENDAHATVVLHTRFPAVPNLGDLTSIDWTQVPAVDIVTAGFPCQDISFAGQGAGIKEGTRSGLWFTIADAVRVLRPRLVLLENVAALRTRGLATVLRDLAALGYDTAWTCLRASDIGAPHRRDRMFVAATYPARLHPQHQRPRTPAIVSPRSDLPRGCRLPQTASHTDRQRRHRGPESGTRGGSEPAWMRGIVADSVGVQRQRRGDHKLLAGSPPTPATHQSDAAQRRRPAPPNTEGQRRDEGQPEPARLPHLGCPPNPDQAADVDWGVYEPAIRRWETILGRPAPQPTETGTRGQPRLSARFVEWMMGLDDGWVTAIPLTRNAQMRILGNGVVPQQATAAIKILHDLLPDRQP
jgi:DNA (cytosine-5)-methyltransferase 1